MADMWFYIDDSGTRGVDRPSTSPPSKPDWFAFGGVLFNDENKPDIERAYDRFVGLWPRIAGPLHSNEIRMKEQEFDFLKGLSSRMVGHFHDELADFLLNLPVVVHACIIDRPGYLDRFGPVHGHERLWKLCKSAFVIAVERAAKYAEQRGRRLRLAVERNSKREDQAVRGYLDELLEHGPPFGAANSSRYSPMTAARLRNVVSRTIEFTTKKSRCMQIADLFLYPVTQEHYCPQYGPLLASKAAGKLIDQHLSIQQVASGGIKYYCFPENTKAPESEPLAA